MRVLWLSPGFAADENDLNCIPPLQLLASELIAQGIDLQIITLDYPFRGGGYRWNEIPVFSGNGQLRWFNRIRAKRFAERANTQQKFDVIHSFWLGPCWLIGQHLSKKWGIPHYTTLMGQDVLPSNRYRHFLRQQHTASLVALSDFHNDVFQATTGYRAACIVPWGQGGLSHLPTQRPLDILGCGSLISVKNWTLWLQVVAAVAASKPELRAELIGGGVEQPILEHLIQQYGLENIVVLRGSVPRPQVLERMRAAKVLLHTAHFESFGFVLTEAAMNGCRVVSTPVGIAPQLTNQLGRTPKELSIEVLHALNAPLLDKPNIPFTMEETAQAYLRMYNGYFIC
jgi:glycosyltransferase involved in cell wall biosynthesis